MKSRYFQKIVELPSEVLRPSNDDLYLQRARMPEPLRRSFSRAEILEFIQTLERNYGGVRGNLLSEREARLTDRRAGKNFPGPVDMPAEVTSPDWQVVIPESHRDQRLQFTGGVTDAGMLIKLMNARVRYTAEEVAARGLVLMNPREVDEKGVKYIEGEVPFVMPDAEDAASYGSEQVNRGLQNAVLAYQGKLSAPDRKRGTIKVDPANVKVGYFRPRGLALDHELAEGQGRPGEARRVSASIYDLVHVLLGAGYDVPGIIFPKIENHKEAAWVDGILADIEEKLGLPRNTIKIQFLIEAEDAAYDAEQILYAVRDRCTGLIDGKFDRLGSFTENHETDRDHLIPLNISDEHPIVTRTQDLLVSVCHKHGALAIGPMTTNYPLSSRPREERESAIQQLRDEKARLAARGMDSGWVGHPEQAREALPFFPHPNQLRVQTPFSPDFNELVPRVTPEEAGETEADWRDAARKVVIFRTEDALKDRGAFPLDGSMEDRATDRIRRAALKQRVGLGMLSAERLRELFLEETEKLAAAAGEIDERLYRQALGLLLAEFGYIERPRIELPAVDTVTRGRRFGEFRAGDVYVHPESLEIDNRMLDEYVRAFGIQYRLVTDPNLVRRAMLPGRVVPTILPFLGTLDLSVGSVSFQSTANLGYRDVAAHRLLTRSDQGLVLFAASAVSRKWMSGDGRSGFVDTELSGFDRDGNVLITFGRRNQFAARPGDSETLGETKDAGLGLLAGEHRGRDWEPEGFPWIPNIRVASGEMRTFEQYVVGQVRLHGSDFPGGGFPITDEHIEWTLRLRNPHPGHHDRAAAAKIGGIFEGGLAVYGGLHFAVMDGLASHDFNGLIVEAGFRDASHTSPVRTGNVLTALSRVVAKREVPGRTDIGVLEVEQVVLKNTRVELGSRQITLNAMAFDRQAHPLAQYGRGTAYTKYLAVSPDDLFAANDPNTGALPAGVTPVPTRVFRVTRTFVVPRITEGDV